MDNRAGEMEVFVAAAERGSFSAAGRKLGLSPSAVSKIVTRIEGRLGTRLIVRSTRALQLTPEGETYLERAQRILGEIDETERVVAGGAESRPAWHAQGQCLGRVRRVLSSCRWFREFLSLYPQVELDLSLTDGVIDLIEERADIAIRVGALRDSSLKARKLLESSPRDRRIARLSRAARQAGDARRSGDGTIVCVQLPARPGEWPFRDPGGASPR